MKNKVEICNKCNKILDKAIKQLSIIDDSLCQNIEKFIIDNYEILKEEKEYKTLIIKYILLQERKK